MKKLISAALLATAITVVAASPASADHSWGGYHWDRASTTQTANVNVDLGDNLLISRSTDWPTIFDGLASTGANVADNWTKLNLFPLGIGNDVADILNTPSVTGANLTSQKRCKPTSGRVEVCNASYGRTGWLGLAQVWTSGGHIVQGTAKVNDTYLDASTYSTADKQHVLCQEVGHTFGLGHTSEDGSDQNTCMDYARGLENPHTNAHDNEQINAIYTNHSHPPGAMSSSVSSAGSNSKVRRLEDDLYVEEFANGDKRFVFVTWKDRAAAAAAPSDRIPE